MHSIKAATLILLAASGAVARYAGYLNARGLDLDDHLDLAVREAYDDELDLYARDIDDFKDMLFARALNYDPDMFTSYAISRRDPPKNTPAQQAAAKAAFRTQAQNKLEGKTFPGKKPLPVAPFPKLTDKNTWMSDNTNPNPPRPW